MPLLLLIPLLLAGVVVLWLVLLPFGLWARYRNGGARRRAVPWAIRLNVALLALSLPLFLLSAWITQHWIGDALRDAALGLLAGVLVGGLGLALTRFEPDAGGFHYTPSRVVVLALTVVVALRILAGMWLSARGMGDLAGVTHPAAPGAAIGVPATAMAWLRGGGWFGVGGLLLGYHAAYAWGLRARLPRRGAGAGASVIAPRRAGPAAPVRPRTRG
jgi:hypothetical protein